MITENQQNFPKTDADSLLAEVRAIIDKAKSDICWHNEDLDLVEVIEDIYEKLIEYSS